MRMPINGGSGSSRDYRRGAIMGLTVAEAFILLSFVLLLLFTWWQVDSEQRSLPLGDELSNMTATEKAQVIELLMDGTFTLAQQLRETGVADTLRNLTEEEQLQVVSGLSDGSLALARQMRAAGLGEAEALLAHRLKQAGIDLHDQAAFADTERYSRFMREEDFRRLMDGAVELAPGTRLKLSEVIEVTPETRLRASLEELLRPVEAVSLASQRLADAAAAEKSLVEMLEGKLGDQIRAAGGEIAADGTITLPQNILFDAGSAQIRDPLFLRQFCAPWVRTLQSSDLDISELKIEGHASSEGLPSQTSEQSYLYNLDLSQRRAQSALHTCLEGLDDTEVLNWARGRLSAVGYSSARQVRDTDGKEDREASRRVMFGMEMNRERLLEEIREDLSLHTSSRQENALPEADVSSDQTTTELPDPSRITAEEGSRGIPRIIDGDSLVIDERRWRLSGIDAPEIKQNCRAADGITFACGLAARDALIKLVGPGEVECYELEKDRYSRSVGICRVGGKDLGEEMVLTGMAVPYLEYSAAYEVQGQIAQVENYGLWSGEFEMPSAFRKMQ